MIDFTTTTLDALARGIANDEYTAADLHAASKKTIEAQNDTINAFVEVFNEDPSNLHKNNSPLFGIPVAIKDNILIEGKIASAGSKMLSEYVASYDAFVIQKLRAAGALIMGRTNMDEFAMGSSTETSYHGPTKNPVDTSRVPGGSSGGSAAAVASGMVPYALGSDTGGSIRQPAAYCGVVGMKPSYGAVSRRGLIAMASSLDVIGPITQTVADAETVFNTVDDYDPEDNTSVPLETRAKYQEKNTNNKVIGVPRAFVDRDGISPAVKENFEQSLKKMKDLGYSIVDIELPTIEHALAVYYILQPAEASSNLARYDGIRYGFSPSGADVSEGYMNTKTEGFGKEVKRRIMLGAYVLSSGYHDEYYYKARALRAKITQEVHDIFESIDIIATPTTPNAAFKFGEKNDPIAMYLEDIFTVPYNLTGNPAISIPSGHNEENLPLGMHFTAPMFCEKKLFSVAKDFEKAIV